MILILKLNTSLKELNTRFEINTLSLNIEKTCYMLFSSSPKNCIKLVLNDIDVQKVHMCKYLGLYFDDQLTWRFHIDYVYNRLLQLIGIFYKLRSKLQYVWLTNIYYAFVHPYLMYGIEIYANTYITYLDKLVKINNKLLRILQNQPLATPVSQLYTSFNLLPIDKLHMLQILLLVFKCLFHNDLVPSIYHNYFVLNNEIHNYNTRLSQGLHICCENIFWAKCIQFKGSSLWKRLPSSLKFSSVAVFKKNLNQLIHVSNICISIYLNSNHMIHARKIKQSNVPHGSKTADPGRCR